LARARVARRLAIVQRGVWQRGVWQRRVFRFGFEAGTLARVSALAVLGGWGCFSGADALGLPCTVDRDCGLDQRCVEGFCGGPPSAPESSSSTTAAGTSSESSSESGHGECAVGPSEPGYCMPLDPGVDDALCNFDCTSVRCGDGHENAAAGEQCEPVVPGQSTCDCDAADCSMSSCGDMQINTIAGEDCDDGDDDDYDDCAGSCRSNTFADPLAEAGDWTVESDGIPDGWQHDAEAGAWWSGDYDIFDQKTDPGRAVAGVTRLFSPPIEITAREGEVLALRFVHRYDFDPYCGDPDLALADGGRVELWSDGAALAWPEAERAYPDDLDTHFCSAPNQNPLGNGPAFAGTNLAAAELEIELPEGAYGTTVQIVFSAGFDCGLCDISSEPDGWRVDAVRIGPVGPGSCLLGQ
jgi:hypothetical protein